MKKVFAVSMVLALTLALVSSALAAVPAPGGPFSSAFRVQNLEDTNALCSVSYYGPMELTSDPEPIEPGDSLFVYVPNVDGLQSGSYSAVVSCDRKVAAVTNYGDDVGGLVPSGASYSGIASPSSVWYAPGIYDNYVHYYSNIVVQNASTGPADIKVEIFEPGVMGPIYTQEANNVQPNYSVSFDQEDTPLADNKFYSAIISGFVAGTETPAAVAAVVNIYGRDIYNDQLFSYNPFTTGSTMAYAPVIMNDYYDYRTALVIQNIGENDAEVKVTYTNGVEQTNTIEPGAPWSIFTPGVPGIPAGDVLYGATVESTNGEPIVVLVNEASETNRAASYSGFAAGSNEVRAPIVLKRYFEWSSSVTCQNIGDAATTMTISYAEGATGPTTSDPVDVGKTWLFYQPNDPNLPAFDDWISSATITASENIVCVVNQDKNEEPALSRMEDQLYAYNGIDPANP